MRLKHRFPEGVWESLPLSYRLHRRWRGVVNYFDNKPDEWVGIVIVISLLVLACI